MISDINERLRRQVAERARGSCEYCCVHEDDAGYAHQVDHVISRKHGGQSVFANLAYSRIVCNRFKGSDIASVDQATSGIVRLFNPRVDAWEQHFRLAGPSIVPLAQIGQVTVSLLRMNARNEWLSANCCNPSDDIASVSTSYLAKR